MDSPDDNSNNGYRAQDGGVKRSLDEEFFNQSTFRTQDRIETGDNDLNSNYSVQGEDFSPENMDGEFLKG